MAICPRSRTLFQWMDPSPPPKKSLGPAARHRCRELVPASHRLLGGNLSKVLTLDPKVFRGHGRISLLERHGLLTPASVKLKLNHSTSPALSALSSLDSQKKRGNHITSMILETWVSNAAFRVSILHGRVRGIEGL